MSEAITEQLASVSIADATAEHVPVIAVSVSSPEYRNKDSHVTFRVSTHDTALPTPPGAYVPDLRGICSIYPVSGPVLTTVYRRFSSFLALRALLQSQYPACIIPPCPEKHFSLSGLDDSTLMERCRGLHMFLSRLAQHPILATSPAVQAFIYGEDPDILRIHEAARPSMLYCEELVERAGGVGERDRLSTYGWTYATANTGNEWCPVEYYQCLLAHMHLDDDASPANTHTNTSAVAALSPLTASSPPQPASPAYSQAPTLTTVVEDEAGVVRKHSIPPPPPPRSASSSICSSPSTPVLSPTQPTNGGVDGGASVSAGNLPNPPKATIAEPALSEEVVKGRYSVWNMLAATVETVQGLLTTVSHTAVGAGGSAGTTSAVCVGGRGDKECEQVLQWLSECEERTHGILRYCEELYKNHCLSDDALVKVGASFARAAHVEASHREVGSSTALAVVARAAERVGRLREGKNEEIVFVRELCGDQQRWIKCVRECIAKRAEVVAVLSTMLKAAAQKREKLQAAVTTVLQERGQPPVYNVTASTLDASLLQDARVAALHSDVRLLERIARRQKRWVEAYTGQLLVELARWRGEYKGDVARTVRAVAVLNQRWCEERERIWSDAVAVVDNLVKESSQ